VQGLTALREVRSLSCFARLEGSSLPRLDTQLPSIQHHCWLPSAPILAQCGTCRVLESAMPYANVLHLVPLLSQTPYVHFRTPYRPSTPPTISLHLCNHTAPHHARKSFIHIWAPHWRSITLQCADFLELAIASPIPAGLSCRRSRYAFRSRLNWRDKAAPRTCERIGKVWCG
jgi:hypothetical protein